MKEKKNRQKFEHNPPRPSCGPDGEKICLSGWNNPFILN